MPTGPGDEILDAIEAGTADNLVMKKYGINSDQLKAFKSLHYGLSNQKMAYDEIENYYPEINKYFKLGPYLPKEQPAKPSGPTIEKPDFTKPVKQKQAVESTAQPVALKDFQHAAESGKAGETLQQKFDAAAKQSAVTLNKELAQNDDVVEHVIRQGRYDQAKEKSLTAFANAPRTDMPAANMLAGVRNRVLQPEAKPQDMPVAPEEVLQKKTEIQGNEQQARDFINKISVYKPDKGQELQKSAYMLDAYERMKQTPDIGLKVNKNLHELEQGSLKYNPATQQLQRELGFVDALVSGVKERTRQLNNYDMFQKPDDQLTEILETRRASFDPDEPVDVPKGAAEIGQMMGMEWKTILKGSAIGAVANSVGAGEVAPYITAALSAGEYYKRGYSTTFEETYDILRKQGKDPQEAIKLAREQADAEGKLNAAEGAVSAIVGGRIGMRDLPKFNITGGFKSAVKGMLRKSAHYAGETGIDGLVDGLVAGAMQERKDLLAADKGIVRDTEKNIRDNVMGELTFSLAMGALTTAGKHLIDPGTYKKITYWLARQPKESVDAQLGTMVMHGEMTEDDAKEVRGQLEAQRKVDQTVPDDVKDVSRMAMLDKIKERDELEEKKKTVDKALHPEIQEQIDKLNDEIIEHSRHKKSTDEDEAETKAETQAEAEGISVEPEQQAEITSPADEGAAELTVEGTAAPAGVQEQTQAAPNNELRYTNPEGTQYVLRGDQLSMVKKNGEEVPFTKKAMQTKGTQELVETIKQANELTAKAPAAGMEAQGMAGEEGAGLQKITPQQQKIIDASIGMAPSVQAGRIMPAPIPNGAKTSKKKWQIISDLSKGLKQRLIYAKGGPGVLGAYYPGFKGIKISNANDLDTVAHEIGHAIDDHFDLYTAMATDPDILQELDQFSSYGSIPPSNHPNPRRYIDKEGFAEWMRAYIVNPDEAEAMAPKLTALYKQSTTEKFKEVIKQFSDDYRTWRFSEGRDITLSNVRTEYEEQKSLIAKLFKKEETNSDFTINWVNRLAANYVNPLNAFEKAFNYAKGIRGIDQVLPANDPIILARILNGIDGKFGEILQSGMIDSENNLLKDGNGNPKNLQWLLEPFDNTDSASIKRDMDDTIAFMIAERTVELSKKLGRQEELTGLGDYGFSDFEVAQKTLNEFYNGDAKRFARIQEAAARYREFADDMLKYAVGKGRMSQETYNEIKANNDQYVALQRFLQTEPDQELIAYPRSGGKELGSKSEITHKIMGSVRGIESPYANLLDILYKTIRESDRNETMRAFRDMLVDPRYSNTGQPKRLADIGIIGEKNDVETIPIFVKGKPEYWIFQKDIYKQLKAFDLDPFRVWTALRIPAQVLRWSTVHFPSFAFRNWIRDLEARLILSTTGSGFKHLVGNKEDWHAIARAGGLNSGYYLKSKNHYYGLLTEAMSEMAQNKNIIVADPVRLKHLWHKYEDLLYKGETSNRVAEYRAAWKKAKDQGMDDYNASIYAAFKARDLVDFAIAGHHMQKINQIIPFTNAAVQGLRSAAISAKTNFWGFAGRMLVYSIVPGVAAWVYNNGSDDDKKRYKELPAYQRDMFWNFRIGPNKWLSLPKPFELALPQAGIDRALSYIYAGQKDAFDGYGADVRKLLFPLDEGNVSGSFQSIIEGLANYDFFRETTIIPPDEELLDLSLRHTETASRLGRLLQEFSGWDARKWDHFIKKQFSYTGNFTLKLSDIGVEKGRHEFDLSDTGLFKRSPAYNSKSVQDMLKYAKGFGLTRTPAYKGFNEIVGRYFTADNDEQKEKIAEEMIDYASELLTAWKDRNIDSIQKAKADAKKEARAKK